MTTITEALDQLEARAASYTGTPGPAGEVQQRASAIIADRQVQVTRRDGQVHHYEVTGRDMMVSFCRTRSEAEAALA